VAVCVAVRGLARRLVVVMTVGVVIVMSMHVGVLMHVNGHRIFTAHAELGRAHAGAHHLFRPDRVWCDRQRAERTADVVERHAGIDQRAEHHVARGAREAIEVENPQIQPILPKSARRQPSARGSCPASANE